MNASSTEDINYDNDECDIPLSLQLVIWRFLSLMIPMRLDPNSNVAPKLESYLATKPENLLWIPDHVSRQIFVNLTVTNFML